MAVIDSDFSYKNCCNDESGKLKIDVCKTMSLKFLSRFVSIGLREICSEHLFKKSLLLLSKHSKVHLVNWKGVKIKIPFKTCHLSLMLTFSRYWMAVTVVRLMESLWKMDIRGSLTTKNMVSGLQRNIQLFSNIHCPF